MPRQIPTALLFCLVLVACGADGYPLPPASSQPTTPRPGLTLSGDARIGVVSN
jgi:hypothetical protein